MRDRSRNRECGCQTLLVCNRSWQQLWREKRGKEQREHTRLRTEINQPLRFHASLINSPAAAGLTAKPFCSGLCSLVLCCVCLLAGLMYPLHPPPCACTCVFSPQVCTMLSTSPYFPVSCPSGVSHRPGDHPDAYFSTRSLVRILSRTKHTGEQREKKRGMLPYWWHCNVSEVIENSSCCSNCSYYSLCHNVR